MRTVWIGGVDLDADGAKGLGLREVVDLVDDGLGAVVVEQGEAGGAARAAPRLLRAVGGDGRAGRAALPGLLLADEV